MIWEKKGQKVQLMAEIYAKASCVIVWLENVTGDHQIDSEAEAAGRQAIRALEAAAAASASTEASLDDEEKVLLDKYEEFTF